MNYDIIIIGGGPAGIMAAITAARCGRKVCILEHGDRIGKKILSTGNGKCNLTNLHLTKACYRSDSAKELLLPVELFSPEDLRQFFADIGVLTKDRNGYVYPNSEQASSVLDALRQELAEQKVTVFTGVHILSVKGGFRIATQEGIFSCRKLILATGSKAAPKTGSDGSGYELAKCFGHRIIPPIPALVQLRCKESFYKELHGVRTECNIRVICNNQTLAHETGELQLTDYGISGIPVFQISRIVKRQLEQGASLKVLLDFLPQHSEEATLRLLRKTCSIHPKADLQTALSGIFNKKLAGVLLKKAGLKPNALCSTLQPKELKTLAILCKGFVVIPEDTNGFDQAQVTAGGVSMAEIQLDTMESTLQAGLYFAGELMDVDGICGGYNLQWAFSTGYLAGKQSAL